MAEGRRAPFPALGLKRAADVCLSLVVAVLSLPVAVVVVAAMAIDMAVCPADRGGFLDRERRVSQGREFDLLKLRTLRRASESPSLTWAGRRLLRPWYLDELPQLWNIVRGDMSLVGPRPWPPAMVAAQVARGVDYRLHVRAGWTGPGQVTKGRGASYEPLDLEYVDRCRQASPFRLLCYDLGILRRTVGTIRRGEGLRF